VDDIQVACYKILNNLFQFGTDSSIYKDRKFIKVEIDRHRPAIGSCLGAFASTFPVAFLEPHLNKHNPYCIHGKLQEHSLEAQGNKTCDTPVTAFADNCYLTDVMSRLESSIPTLETLLAQVEQFVTSEKSYNEAPYIIDVMLPMLCSYLPFWWAQGPDNQDPTGGYEEIFCCLMQEAAD
jgi:ryanodine receptor 2